VAPPDLLYNKISNIQYFSNFQQAFLS
jgi:hypothetical protein